MIADKEKAQKATAAATKAKKKKPWEGSFSDTKADRSPRSDGPVQPHLRRKCLSQITVTYKWGLTGIKKWRGSNTCTSCKRGFAFVMLWHKSRAGLCQPYQRTSRITMVPLDDNVSGAGDDEQNTLTTKWVRAMRRLHISKLKRKARTHFKKAQGYFGSGVSVCCFGKRLCAAHAKEEQTAR